MLLAPSAVTPSRQAVSALSEKIAPGQQSVVRDVRLIFSPRHDGARRGNEGRSEDSLETLLALSKVETLSLPFSNLLFHINACNRFTNRPHLISSSVHNVTASFASFWGLASLQRRRPDSAVLRIFVMLCYELVLLHMRIQSRLGLFSNAHSFAHLAYSYWTVSRQINSKWIS